MPILTVIMPVYNGEKYLKESIDSVLNQTFKDFTLLILNDNSTDGTAAILENYTNQDSRISVVTKLKNEGPANLRNEGIERSTTEFVALLDADDIAIPTRFEKQLAYLNSHPEVGVCGSWFTFFGGKRNKLVRHAVTHDELKVQFLHSCGIGNPTVMFRKGVLGGLKFEHQYVPAEDYGLWSQLISKTKFYNIPESLLLYRWHDSNISQTKVDNLRISERLIKINQLKFIGIDPNNEHIDSYVNAVSLKREQSTQQVKNTIRASFEILNNNDKINYFDSKLLKNHVERTIVRTIRNVKKPNLSFFKYVQHESGYFTSISFIDKLSLFLKSLF